MKRHRVGQGALRGGLVFSLACWTFLCVSASAGVPPVIPAITNQYAYEGTEFTFTVLATDADVPPQQLTFRLSTNNTPPEATIDPGTGQFRWTPTEGYGPGNGRFRVIVTDSGVPSLSATQDFTIIVREVNSPPVLEPIPDQTITEGSLLVALAIGSDPDLPLNPLTYTLGPGRPPGATISPSGLILWQTTEASGPSTNNFQVILTDNGSEVSEFLSVTQRFTVVVTEVNRAPVVPAIAPRTVTENTTLSFTVTASDPDLPPQKLTYSLGAGDSLGATINPTNGNFRWTPGELQGPGTYFFSVFVTDNGSPPLQEAQGFLVTVEEQNSPPSIAPIPSQQADVGTLLQFGIPGTDPDFPQQPLTYALGPEAPAGANITADGLFTWTPNIDQAFSTNQIQVSVTDGSLAATQTFVVIVGIGVNLPPVLAPLADWSVGEGELIRFTPSVSDLNRPAQQIRFSLGPGTPGGAGIDPDTGEFSWIPGEGQGPGSYQVIIVATDDGTPSLSGAQSFLVSVEERNVAPVFLPTPDQIINQGGLLVLPIRATDSDLPLQALAYSLEPGAPAGAALTADGLFSWAPGAAQAHTTNRLGVIVTDGSLSATQHFTVVVQGINMAPVLAALPDRSVAEGESISFQASASDANLPSQSLAYRLRSDAPAGAVIDPETGEFFWTPGEAQGPGVYQIGIIVTDNGTPPLGDARSFLVTVGEVNRPPVVHPIPDQVINQGGLLVLSIRADDPDIPVQTLSFSLAPGAPKGALLRSDGLFSWTPSPTEAFSTNQFRVVVTDGSLSATQSFVVVVTGVNFAPVLEPLASHVVAEGEVVNFSAVASDANLPTQTLSYRLGSGAPAGAEINSATGEFNWVPSEAQGPGNYQIGIIVTDDGVPAQSDAKTFLVTVEERNQPPTITPIEDQTINQGGLLVLTLRAGDPDIPLQSLSFSLEPGAPAGAAVTANGLFTWTPSVAQAFTTNRLGVIVTDGILSATQRFDIVVVGINLAPTMALLPDRTLGEGELLTFAAVGADANLPAQRLTYGLGAGAPPGAAIDAQTGVFTWTPTEAQGPGSYRIGITVTDDGSPPQSAAQSFLVTVEERNRAPEIEPIATRSVAPGSLLSFQITASDPDFPLQPLVFSLGPQAPPGCAITAGGLFTWTPPAAQSLTTNRLSVIVSDGSLSATQTFVVVVLNGSLEPPRLVNPIFAAGSFSATVDSLAGRRYFFERTMSLDPAGWAMVGEFLGVGGPMSLTDPAATNAVSIYRARVE